MQSYAVCCTDKMQCDNCVRVRICNRWWLRTHNFVFIIITAASRIFKCKNTNTQNGNNWICHNKNRVWWWWRWWSLIWSQLLLLLLPLNGSHYMWMCMKYKGRIHKRNVLNEIMCLPICQHAEWATEAEMNLTESIAIRAAWHCRFVDALSLCIHHECKTIHINKRQ